MRYVTSLERIGMQRGMEKGMEKGLEKGMEKGMEKGLAMGLQQALQSERRMLLRLVRRHFGEAVAERTAPVLEQIQQLLVLEDLSEALFDCPDEPTWLARIGVAAQSLPDSLPNNGMSP